MVKTGLSKHIGLVTIALDDLVHAIPANAARHIGVRLIELASEAEHDLMESAKECEAEKNGERDGRD